jgi:hypothetical protein
MAGVNPRDVSRRGDVKPYWIALGAVLAAGLATTGPVVHRDPVAVDVAFAQAQGLSVAGNTVGRLFPGARRDLALVVTNPYGFPITLTAVSGRLAATSRRTCAISTRNLTVGRYAGSPRLPLRIAAHGRARIGHLPITMPTTVSNACQGVTFTLRLSATAEKAKR